MPNRNIHIENLRIHLPSDQAGRAHEIADAFGKEILHALAKSTEGKFGTLNVGAIEIHTPDLHANAPERQKWAAGRVADALVDKIG